MQRNVATFLLDNDQYQTIKNKMLNWADQFSIFVFLDSNSYNLPHSNYEVLLAIGNEHNDIADSLEDVQIIHQSKRDWLFGHINYDFKNELEPTLTSSHTTQHGFQNIRFFIPEIVCYIKKNESCLYIESSVLTPEVIFNFIIKAADNIDNYLPKISFQSKINKDQYQQTVQQLQKHIEEGDCYEINFCNEGYCEDATINPLQAFNALNKLSPAPFAAFYRLGHKYLMCSSPERYLHKKANKILSQPIKGTARRSDNAREDATIKELLRNDIKERAENVMIVDLTRNDIARSCKTGTVEVEELFGIYSFPRVHQMISTITGQLDEGTPFTDAIKYSFPMGSMTGAPKIKVMELIEKYEITKRELFSGTVGYITPDGDFDFNVIIRSLFYNTQTKYLSYQTGGAITYDSIPEKEWEEMRLKAWALEHIFNQ